MQGNVLAKKKKGGKKFDINGIIEEYQVASGGNINAGDFVKFVTNYNSLIVGEDTHIINTESSSMQVKAVKLNENKVCLIHNLGESNYLYGIVCTINETVITAGTNTQLIYYEKAGSIISPVVLNESKIFIVTSRYYNSNQYMHGLVCTISGTTIVKKSDRLINDTTGVGYTISAVKLDESRVFVAHSYGTISNSYIGALVCTISGTSISIGTDVVLNSSTYTGKRISAVALSEDKVFIAHSYGTSFSLYRIICTISGTSIGVGTDIQLSNASRAGEIISAVALSEDKVFVAHSYTHIVSYSLARGSMYDSRNNRYKWYRYIFR